jgi:anti-sigma B factor antagonist
MQRARDEPHFELEVRQDAEGRTVIVAAGEIDMVTSVELREAVVDKLAAGDVLLDLRQVSFMDSSGVAAVDGALRASEAGGGRLRVCEGLQPNVMRILELTGVARMIEFEPCGQQA